MYRLLLSPDDFLFHRDGRPMTGSLSGDGANWPQPCVLASALHAACHQRFRPERGRRHFGELVTAGPWPVDEQGRWYFPRPLDVGPDGQLAFLPAAEERSSSCSLPRPLTRSVLPLRPPGKESSPPWCSCEGFLEYLDGRAVPRDELRKDAHFFSSESSFGIALQESTGTVESGRFYSSQRLRLKEEVKLGALASTASTRGNGTDLTALFQRGSRVLFGGERRTCRVTLTEIQSVAESALPRGRRIHGRRVKWTLLSPAIFPRLEAMDRPLQPGGWLPNWIDAASGEVHLLDGPGRRKAARMGRPPGEPIRARLVAAIVGSPEIVTGWSLPGEGNGAAKHALRAVPAGSVYFFEAADDDHARKLSAALDWSANEATGLIRQRRSVLMGEKGYGLGVCSPWSPFPSLPNRNSSK